MARKWQGTGTFAVICVGKGQKFGAKGGKRAKEGERTGIGLRVGLRVLRRNGAARTPLAGRSRMPSWHPLTRRRPRFAVPAALVGIRLLPGHGQPLFVLRTAGLDARLMLHGDDFVVAVRKLAWARRDTPARFIPGCPADATPPRLCRGGA